MEKKERIKHLVCLLNNARYEYYNNNYSIMTDYEYDELFTELQNLENITDYILPNSPTISVGYTSVNKLTKVSHKIPLLSLAKTKSIDEVLNFIKQMDSILMYKYDGLTCELIYDKGILKQASTRGNGYIGEDITHNARTFKNIPLRIQYKGYLKIVGEAIIKYDDFEKINQKLPMDDKYKNPRNLVSGSVRQLDSNICKERNVYFMPWDILEYGKDFDKTNTLFNSAYRSLLLSNLQDYGFTLPEIIFVNKECLSSVEKHINILKNKAREENIPIDGIVIKYDDINYSKSLGGTSHHNNNGLAFKFYDEEVGTTLINIEWSMGKTGILTPVAIFEPIQIDGTTITKASLSNLSILRKTLGDHPFVNQKIYVTKRNGIIPKIEWAEDENGKAI